MASLTGTFSAPQQKSLDLALAPGETANVILTLTGTNSREVQVQQRVGNQYSVLARITADATGTKFNNDSADIQYLRLLCVTLYPTETIAYTLADVAGQSLPGYPITNAQGTVVFDVADDGIEAPKVTAASVVGDLTGNVTGNVTGNLTGDSAGTHVGTSALTSGTAGAAGTWRNFQKLTTAIADNVATTVLTVTVPNVKAAAVIRITAMGSLGAGGAIGAGEAIASNSYDLTIVRTAGVNAVADISTAYGVNAAAVAGAATCTAALTVASVVGAVGASNSFPVQITIVKSGGASDNHTAQIYAEVINQFTGGVTVA